MTEVHKLSLTEKQVLIDILQLYQESPYLWNSSHNLYSHRETRSSAYQKLLNKYRLLVPDASIMMLKKKLENMRTSYRRERKKVLTDLLENGEERKPTLWYYDYLKFLDGEITPEITEVSDSQEADIEDDEKRDVKLQKMETTSNLSSIFLTEEHLDPEDSNESYTVQGSGHQLDTNTHTSETTFATEGETFGRTVGMQLNELQPVQRFMAEKLISEVIYYARFEKLNITTKLTNV